jgi:hypothetical protein
MHDVVIDRCSAPDGGAPVLTLLRELRVGMLEPVELANRTSETAGKLFATDEAIIDDFDHIVLHAARDIASCEKLFSQIAHAPIRERWEFSFRKLRVTGGTTGRRRVRV